MEAMPEAISRRCPSCGRKAHNNVLVQCPDCRVPFVFEEQPYAGLTPEQLRLIGSQILGSWKFWAAVAIIVGAAAWATVKVSDRVIDARANAYLNRLEETATNHLSAAAGQISNQIALEFRQPRIKAAIEQAARDQGMEYFSNGVMPTLQAFQDAMDLANAQLRAQAARSSNSLSQLELDIEAARRRIPEPTAIAPVRPTAAPAATRPAVVTPEPVAEPAPPPETSAFPDGAVHLVKLKQTVVPAGTNYLLTIFFNKTPTSAANGTVEVDAATYQLTARILNFAPMTAGTVELPIMNDAGDIARLRFRVNDREPPTLVMEFSAPTLVQLISEAFDRPITIVVGPFKMPAAGAN